MPVKIIGAHAGVSVGPDGATHQALEDIALMRTMPRMTVLCPCDSEEARKATLAAVDIAGPVYVRLTREKTPVMTTGETPFAAGKANMVWESEHAPEVAIFATGPLLYKTLLAAKELEFVLPTTVVNIHTVKPLDKETIVEAAKNAGAVVTVEEHQIAGGLGGAIAEMLSENCPLPIEFVGIRDQFGQSGEPQELIEHYGMGTSAIVAAIKKAKERKR